MPRKITQRQINNFNAARQAAGSSGPQSVPATPLQYTLTITESEDGSVVADPAGPRYNLGTPVVLTATADEDFEFDGWTVDDVAVEANPTTVTMNSDHTVAVAFAAALDLSGYAVFDNFNRVDGAVGSALTGQAWVLRFDGGSTGIVGNQLRPGPDCEVMINTGSLAQDITVTMGTPVDGSIIYFLGSISGGTVTPRGHVRFVGDTCRVVLNGSTKYNQPFTLAPGDVVHIVAGLSGPNATQGTNATAVVSVNDVEIANVFQDSFGQTFGNYAGMGDWTGDLAKYDSFAVDAP